MKKLNALRLLQDHKETICQRFGSTVRDEARDNNDINVLVEFDGPSTSDRYFGLRFYLEDLFGCPVDLVTDKALRPELRPTSKRKPSVSREWRFYVSDMIASEKVALLRNINALKAAGGCRTGYRPG